MKGVCLETTHFPSVQTVEQGNKGAKWLSLCMQPQFLGKTSLYWNWKVKRFMLMSNLRKAPASKRQSFWAIIGRYYRHNETIS